jgi:hypothetical protein
MRALSILVAGLAIAVVPAVVDAQDSPDFSGKWKFDQSLSQGAVTPPPQLRQMRATQNSRRPGDVSAGRMGGTPGIAPVVPGQSREGTERTATLKVNRGVLEMSITTNGISESLKFKLDGTESENDFFPPRAQSAVKLKTTSRWEGAQLVTEGSGVQETEAGRVIYTFSEKRYLNEDGTQMIVEQSIASTGSRPVERKLVYVKG